MSLVVYVIAVGLFIRWMIKYKEKFILNEESLHKQWLFRLAVIFPLASSFYFMIWLGASYPFRWDAIGYNDFLDIQKFSLGILALSPILGVFVVYAHRSIQMDKQIKVTEQKNNFDMYISNEKYIIEELGLIKVGSYSLKDAKNTFKKSIVKVSLFEVKPNDEFYDEINEKLKEINVKLLKFNDMDKSFLLDKIDDTTPDRNYLFSISSSIYGLFDCLKINANPNVFTGVLHKKDTIRNKIEREYEYNEESLPDNIEDYILADMISNIKYELKKSIDIVEEICLILLNYNDRYELLTKIKTIRDTIDRIDESGDKLAAENQNPPE